MANELQSSRTAIDVHIVHASVDLHRNDVLTVGGGLEGRMDEGLVQVQHEGLLALVTSPLGTQKRLGRQLGSVDLRLLLFYRFDTRSVLLNRPPFRPAKAK